jgi:hypothetical protein
LSAIVINISSCDDLFDIKNIKVINMYNF